MSTTANGHEPIENLSPQLHNFVFVVVIMMLCVWGLKTIANARKLQELHIALKKNNVVRIDGLGSQIHEIGSVSRGHLFQILREHSQYDTFILDSRKMPFHLHPKSVTIKIVYDEVLGANRLCFFADVTNEVPVRVELFYGVSAQYLRRLHSERYDPQQKGKKQKKKKAGKRAQSAAPGESGTDIELTQIDAAASETEWPDDAFMFYDNVTVLPPGAERQITIDLDIDKLRRTIESAAAVHPVAVRLVSVQDEAATSDVQLQDTDSPVDEERKEAPVPRLQNKPVSFRTRGSMSEMSLVRLVVRARDRPPPPPPPSSPPPADPAVNPPSLSPANSRADLNSSTADEPSTSAQAANNEQARADEPANEPANYTPIPKVDTQLMVSDNGMFVLHDVFGLEDDASLECTVCLSEPKQIISIPCRHCCVCFDCFENIRGKCPVCRANINSFMQFGVGAAPEVKPPAPSGAPPGLRARRAPHRAPVDMQEELFGL